MKSLAPTNSPLHGRTFLFVPGDRPERYSKAIASGADCVIIDLEDSVDPGRKNTARQAAQQFIETGARVLLRINAADTPWHSEDLELCISPHVLGVVCPKVESACELANLRRALRPQTVVLPLIETAKGVVNVHAIAEGLGVGRLIFGSVDLSLDLDLQPDDSEQQLSWHRAVVVLASRAAGLPAPVDGVFLNLQDEVGFEQASRAARRSGFGGKLCLHPSQVSGVHLAFSASPAERDWALRVLQTAQSMPGAFRFEGRMVDAPVLQRARRLLSSGK